MQFFEDVSQARLGDAVVLTDTQSIEDAMSAEFPNPMEGITGTVISVEDLVICPDHNTTRQGYRDRESNFRILRVTMDPAIEYPDAVILVRDHAEIQQVQLLFPFPGYEPEVKMEVPEEILEELYQAKYMPRPVEKWLTKKDIDLMMDGEPYDYGRVFDEVLLWHETVEKVAGNVDASDCESLFVAYRCTKAPQPELILLEQNVLEPNGDGEPIWRERGGFLQIFTGRIVSPTDINIYNTGE